MGKPRIHTRINYVTAPDGTELSFYRLGSGPALVFVPSVMHHIEIDWRFPEAASWFRHLASHFTVIRYNSRWAASPPSSDLSLESCLQDIHQITGACGLKEFALATTLFGGPVAITYAARFPDRVRALILKDAVARASDWLSTGWARSRELLLQENEWNLLTETMFYPQLGPPLAKRLSEEIRSLSNFESVATVLAHVAEFDSMKDLVRLRCPTLVLHSRDNQSLDIEVSRTIAALIPEARYEELTGSGSPMFLGDHRRQYLRAMEAFLDSTAQRLESAPSNNEKDSKADAEVFSVVGAEGELGSVWEAISNREKDILLLLARGERNQEIADSLGISVHTVERHTSNIYLKLGIKSRAEAAYFAAKHFLMTSPSSGRAQSSLD